MKNNYYKITLVLLLTMAFPVNAMASAYEKNVPIQDELLQKNNLAQTSIKKTDTAITDELLNPDLYEHTPFRLSVYTNKYENQPIKDELLDDQNFIKNSQKPLLSDKIIPDEYFVEKNIDLTKVRKINPKTQYDFTKKQIPIQIKIAERLNSTRQILEGSTIPFIAQHDFEINGKKFNRGTTILGRVENISASDKMGTPESIQISNFYIPDKEEINLYGSITKTGANRALWVYPLYQAGNILFYAAGFIVVPIHGGRAKLLTSESFTVFFETR